MKIFKKLYRNGLVATTVLFLVSALGSCKKYTDLQPYSLLPATVVYTNATDVQLAENAIYPIAGSGNYAFTANNIFANEMRGGDMTSGGYLPNIYLSSSTTQDTYVSGSWTTIYKVVNNLNIFIEGVHKAAASNVITPGAALQYEAEARFLRALCHYELVINFCRPYNDNPGTNLGIPYRTTAVDDQASLTLAENQGRGTVKDTYTQLLSDLDFAETNSPATRANPIIRVTKGAAIALKSRIKLEMNDWTGVINECSKLGANATGGTFQSPVGGYQLTASPDGPFVSYSSNTESILSIENTPTSNPGINSALGAIFGSQDAGGRGFYCTDPNLYNASFWVSSDTRRTLLQVQDKSPKFSHFVYNNKYRDHVTYTDWIPVVRYAEVLLNAAEAYARLNPSDPQALSLLNAVRNRAVASADRYTAASFSAGNTLLTAILNERRIEFAGEGLRWGDLERLAKDPIYNIGQIPARLAISDLKTDGSNYNIITRPFTSPSTAAVPYADHRFIWPIPDGEVTLNPVLAKQQNPGY